MSNRKVDTQEIYEKRRMQDGKQAKEKIPMKPESRSKFFACLEMCIRDRNRTVSRTIANGN